MQPQTQAQQSPFVLMLPPSAVDVVVAGLANLTYKDAAPVIDTIVAQVRDQIASHQQVAAKQAAEPETLDAGEAQG